MREKVQESDENETADALSRSFVLGRLSIVSFWWLSHVFFWVFLVVFMTFYAAFQRLLMVSRKCLTA